MNAPLSLSEVDRGGPRQPLLIVRDLKKHFPAKGGFLGLGGDTVQAVGVSFDVGKGETVGIVGESGCANRPPLGCCCI